MGRMAGTVGTHIKCWQLQLPWIQRTCLKPAGALSEVHHHCFIFQLRCKPHFSHDHHYVFVYAMWQNPLLIILPTTVDIYTRQQGGLWEQSVFCLWLVFYSPSFVLSFLSHSQAAAACRDSKCSDNSGFISLSPPPDSQSAHVYVFHWLM